jgi:hypothetical protein
MEVDDFLFSMDFNLLSSFSRVMKKGSQVGETPEN